MTTVAVFDAYGSATMFYGSTPVQLGGDVAGAQAMIADVAAVQEESDSPISTLGHSYTFSLGHILLTTLRTIIVRLFS